jgi:hypothetical protein
MRNVSLLAFLTLGIASGACSASSKPTSPSVVTGKADLSTFPSKASSVTAVDESGRRTTAGIAADGSFSLPLAKGHTYRLSVVQGTGAVPVVYPRASGRLDATFALRTNGAAIQLGAVRHYAAAPTSGFQVQKVTLSLGSPDAGAADPADCMDCVDDTGSTTCENGDPADSTGSDNSATDPMDTPDQADPAGEMAVAENDPPDTVTGCDGADDGSENNDTPDPKEGED